MNETTTQAEIDEAVTRYQVLTADGYLKTSAALSVRAETGVSLADLEAELSRRGLLSSHGAH